MKRKRSSIPVTRENYLNLAHMGNPPKHLSPEEEIDLPDELRQHDE